MLDVVLERVLEALVGHRAASVANLPGAIDANAVAGEEHRGVVVAAAAERHPRSGRIGIGSIEVHLGYVSFCSVMGDHGSVVRPHEALSFERSLLRCRL
jgi:hypothetical protein